MLTLNHKALDLVVTTTLMLAPLAAARPVAAHTTRQLTVYGDVTLFGVKGFLDLISRLSDKAGSLGSVVAAMGCASCFPAVASLGAALGLGFLSQFEGLFLNTLLPIFAVLALAANGWSAWSHRRLSRLLFGFAGPAMILATLYLFWTDSWSTYLFYAGLAFMLAASLRDLVSPPQKICVPSEPGRRAINE